MKNRSKIKGNELSLRIFHWKTKLKAGALQYALFVSVVIALLLSALISATYLHRKVAIKSNHYLESIQLTNRVFNSLQIDSIAYFIPVTFLNNETEYTLLKTHWGVYDYIKVQTKKGKEIFFKSAFVGNKDMLSPALYLQDDKRPLVLVGNTEIKGKAFLPVAGVKRGYMGGESYYGKQLIYGSQEVSRSRLPQLLNREHLMEFAKNIKNTTAQYIDLNEKDKWVQSFKDTLLLYKKHTVIDIHHKTLTGKILIQSDTLIRIHPSAILQDIILLAPYIEIQSNFTGNFQALASKSILVKKQVQLNYPSALILTNELINDKSTKNSLFPKIVLEEDALVKGQVLYLLKDRSLKNPKAQIELNENSKIIGEVYCEANIEIKGKVTGSIYTRGFVAKEFGANYQNHLYNASINRLLLPKEYVGLRFKNKENKVIKWAY